jgi:hypothetical protein
MKPARYLEIMFNKEWRRRGRRYTPRDGITYFHVVGHKGVGRMFEIKDDIASNEPMSRKYCICGTELIEPKDADYHASIHGKRLAWYIRGQWTNV